MTVAQIRTTAAVLLTIAIITVFGMIVCDRWQDARALPLNNLGDLLAGITAPIAFLWLIVGYFQQGEELRQNTEALMQQKRELERQVEETAKLAQFSAKQAEATALLAKITQEERESALRRERDAAKPKFFFVRGSSVSNGGSATLTNFGGPISQLSVTPLDDCLVDVSPHDIWLTNGQATFHVQHANLDDSVRFNLAYLNSLQEPGEQVLAYTKGTMKW